MSVQDDENLVLLHGSSHNEHCDVNNVFLEILADSLLFRMELRARSEISCAFGRRIRDAMLGAKRAVWLCHTSDLQQRSAPEAGEANVQVISERALSSGLLNPA